MIGRIVTPDGVVDGHLRLDGDRIGAIEPGPVGADPHWIVPGFVDMHVHGGGGQTFTTGDAEAAAGVAAFHQQHGTTTMLASLVSSPIDTIRVAVRAFAPLVADGTLAGIHLEGPYLATARRGAQNPAYLRDPSAAELAALVDEGPVRMVTLAPEWPGALAAIKLLTSRGVVVAVGHTDATYDQTVAAIAAGATVATHLFNCMPPPHHRAPGPVYALLGAPGVTCEVIADGEHLADGTLAFAARVAGPDGIALVTDAIAAAGMPDGDYDLGDQAVAVRGGVARLGPATGSPGALAGSTLTMEAAFRRYVAVRQSAPRQVDDAIVQAACASATNPARALGLRDRGALVVGRRADVVTLDASLAVTAVIRGGAPI